MCYTNNIEHSSSCRARVTAMRQVSCLGVNGKLGRNTKIGVAADGSVKDALHDMGQMVH